MSARARRACGRRGKACIGSASTSAARSRTSRCSMRGGGRIAIHKRLTTPHDPSQAVIEGIAALAARRRRRDRATSAEIVHGTTLVTNAVIERRGAVTGMLATAGFSDILDMGFERRYDLFDLRIKYPPPLVPRRLRLEVAERVRFDGSVERPLDEAGGAARPPSGSANWMSRRSPCASCIPTPIRRTSARAAEILREARARPVRVRPRPTSSRTCASSSAGRRRRSTPSPSRCSTATSSGWRAGWRARLPRPALHHGLERRHADDGHGAPLSRCARSNPVRPPAP